MRETSSRLNLLIYIFLWSWCSLITSATWWLLNVPPYNGNTDDYCSSLRFLTHNQRKFCRHSPTMMEKISLGVNNAINLCQMQFRYEHWNCTMYPGRPNEHAFNPILKSKGKEKAFVHSIISASIAYEVTKACSNGELPHECACARLAKEDPEQKEFQWRGCSDDVNFGIGVVKSFLDSDVKPKTLRHKMQLHNSIVGQNMLRNATRSKCKCHGLSGTCSQHICWEAMPPRPEIGFRLKELYEGAIRVRGGKGKKLRTQKKREKSKLYRSLVYEGESWDYCKRNLKRGSYGTQGRVCNATDHHSKYGCDQMCCRRGYRTENRFAEEACNCNFTWCCVVECERCLQGITESFCR